MLTAWPRLAAALLPLLVVVAASLASNTPAQEYIGDEMCAACHEDIVEAMKTSAHARAPGWSAEQGCEACHGPGGEHAEAGGDPEKIKRIGELAPREAAEVCLFCHGRQEGQLEFERSVHHLGEVSCTDCHNPHSTAETLLDKRGRALCGDCHQAIAMQFELPRAHPIDDCAKCHDPHSKRSLRTDTTLFRRVCTDCHFEKQGPYVFDHDVLAVDGCVSCHEVHGSPNRHLLKHEPQVNLCYQCHSASVTPPWHDAQRFLNEKCTACHTAIHGSNTHPFFLEE